MRRNSQARAANEAAVRRALKRKTALRGTSTQLAREIGISESRVSHIRTGRSPMTEKVAAVLGWRLAWVREDHV